MSEPYMLSNAEMATYMWKYLPGENVFQHVGTHTHTYIYQRILSCKSLVLLHCQRRFAFCTVCISRFSPSLIHGLCAIFASNSRFMSHFQAPLDTCLDNPLLANLSVHDFHFTVYAPPNRPDFLSDFLS